MRGGGGGRGGLGGGALGGVSIPDISPAALAAQNGILHVTNNQNFDPLLFRPPVLPEYRAGSPVSPTFLGCEQQAIAFCFRRFGTSSRSLSECLYGHMVASQLLPPQIMALADDARIDTSGAYAAGASIICTLPAIGYSDGYPAMVDFY